jgi:hypothetical protein
MDPKSQLRELEKGKVHPRTGREVPEGEGGQRHARPLYPRE